MYFRKNSQKYSFSFLGKKIYESNKVAIAVVPDRTGYLLKKHGPPASVQEWKYAEMAKTPFQHRLNNSIIYIELESTSPEELDKMIKTTHYMPEEAMRKIKNSYQ